MNNTSNDNYRGYSEGGKRVSGSQRSAGQRSRDQRSEGQPPRRRRRKKKQSRALYYLILLVLLGILVFSAVKIISYFKQQADASDAQQEITDNYITPGTTPNSDGDSTGDGDDSSASPSTTDPDTITVDFNSMIADYPDVVGYIYCANTNLKNPIQYGKGNDYYLTHDSKGNTNNNGSIFMEAINSSSFSDGNTIIYGHNMKSGLMFADLTKYKDKSYYSSHPYIYIYTPSQNYRLDLYAGFVCEHNDEVYSTSLTQDQLKAMAAKSTFVSNIGTPTGKTVTLSTCSYEFDNARYVVIGALNPISN